MEENFKKKDVVNKFKKLNVMIIIANIKFLVYRSGTVLRCIISFSNYYHEMMRASLLFIFQIKKLKLRLSHTHTSEEKEPAFTSHVSSHVVS